jgi:hypothetical protein
VLGMDLKAYSWLADAAGASPDEGDRFADL